MVVRKLIRMPEYRSAIFFHTPEQEQVAKEVTAEVQEKQYVLSLEAQSVTLLISLASKVDRSSRRSLKLASGGQERTTTRSIVSPVSEGKTFATEDDADELVVDNNPGGYECPTHRFYW